MFEINFADKKVKISVEAGTSILDAARRAGIIIESPCNGAGTCGKCLVRVPVRFRDSIITEKIKQDGEFLKVLACHTFVNADIEVYSAGVRQEKGLEILDHGHQRAFKLKPYITKKYNATEWITEVFADSALIAKEEGDTSKSVYGIVADIGTTTLVLSLFDLISGQELGSRSALNPQARHAQDVLSRIKFSSTQEGLKKMHDMLINELNNMIDSILEEKNLRRDFIYEAVFSGNTTMVYLGACIGPEALGRYPYKMEVPGDVYFRRPQLALNIADAGRIYVPPLISAYVGADIVSGVLATEIHICEDTVLFVDVGTNGEMVLSVKGALSASSTAAGPAFEGMNITFGMRASAGAIEEVKIASGRCDYKTIAGTEAQGICGSGLVDAVGELAANKIIDRNGRFGREASLVEGKKVFHITEKVYLSQSDIRHVQLAKGAVRAGIDMLLSGAGLSYDDVDRVLIAGSFGYHLRPESLINLGLLPKEFRKKVNFVGNTSKSGGAIFLLNRDSRTEMQAVVQNVSVVELANKTDFEKVFVKSLAFPENKEE